MTAFFIVSREVSTVPVLSLKGSIIFNFRARLAAVIQTAADLFQINIVVPRAGLEPATARSSAGCSPSLSYRGFAIFYYCKMEG